MRIGIIGTGHMGTAFAKSLAKTSHEVFIGSREPEKARNLSASVGKFMGGSIKEAVEFGDVLILAVPWSAMNDVLKTAGNLKGKVLVDISNPLKQDFSGLDVTTSASEEIAKIVPDAKIVKAFNTLFAQVLESSLSFKEGKANVFICSDDQTAKEKVSQLASDLGYEPIDVGPLNRAYLVEHLGMLNIVLGFFQKMGTNQAFGVLRK